MSKIVRHSHGIKEMRDELELNRMAFNDAKHKQNVEAVTESNTRIAMIDARDRDNQFLRASADRAALERAALNSATSVLEQGKVKLFKEIMTEAYMGALLLDDYAVKEHAERFEALVGDYIDSNGGYAMLENAVKVHKLPILKAIKEACDKTALEATRRIGREVRENKELATAPIFELNEVERSEFDTKRGELSIDRLSELVKNKVLTVVKDERDRQSKEKELLEDLKNRAAETGEEVEKKPVLGTSTLKESTLFNSIMHNAYIETLNATKEHFLAPPDDDDDDELDAPSISDGDYAPKAGGEIDLELIMCESIVYYTLMELTNTICLETFSRNEIMNMSHKLLNQR